MKLSQPALIHIGGSLFQVASIRWAREAGLFVVVTDKKSDPPGAAVADRFVQLAGDDLEGLQTLAREIAHTHRLVGLWCHADFCLLLRARIHAALGLPGPSPAAVAAALDKNQAKIIWQEQGVATPPARLVVSAAGALSAAREIGLPVVVKPLQASGSAGITRVTSECDLAAAFDLAREWSHTVLVEAYLTGREFGVNGIFHQDRFYPCGISERRTAASGVLLNEVIIPAPLEAEVEEAVYHLLEKSSTSLGIREGCVKGDCILVGDQPYMLEVAPRLHGNPTMSTAIPLATGVNPLRAYFGILAGELDPLRHLKPKDALMVAGYRPLFCEGGRVAAIEGLEQVKALPGVVAVELFIQAGQKVNGHGDNRGIIGYVFGRAESAAELRGIFDAAQAGLQIFMH